MKRTLAALASVATLSGTTMAQADAPAKLSAKPTMGERVAINLKDAKIFAAVANCINEAADHGTEKGSVTTYAATVNDITCTATVEHDVAGKMTNISTEGHNTVGDKITFERKVNGSGQYTMTYQAAFIGRPVEKAVETEQGLQPGYPAGNAAFEANVAMQFKNYRPQ